LMGNRFMRSFYGGVLVEGMSVFVVVQFCVLI
jgi:hypothetical protein